MATSPIYNWPEPDNTDLVKNGALAIRTLGNAIDTTMGTMVAKTVVDAKGDLIVGTAADTVGRLAVAENGSTIVADSSTSTGLRYQGTQAAGKNALINGNFDIWQRGTSSSTLGAYTTADRWYCTAISGTGTFAQEGTVKPSNSNYSLKFTASATSQPLIYQVIETSNALQFAGQNVVLSGKFASSASVTFSLSLEWSASTDVGIGGSWTSITPSSTSAASPTSTTFVDGRAVFAVPSTARSLRVGILPTATIANSVVLYWSQIQLELGSIPTFFTRAGGTIQGELDVSKRYFERITNGGTATGGVICNSYAVGVNDQSGVVNYTEKRIVPSITLSTATNFVGGSTAATSVSIARPSVKTARLDMTVTGSPYTTGQGNIIRWADSVTGSIDVSAEL